jgi:hypothetical protein
MLDGKSISAAYGRAGSDFLANRLEGMFREIKTPEDIALHNVILKEVIAMIGDQPVKFYRVLAHSILLKESKAKKSLYRKVVDSILSVAKG